MLKRAYGCILTGCLVLMLIFQKFLYDSLPGGRHNKFRLNHLKATVNLPESLRSAPCIEFDAIHRHATGVKSKKNYCPLSVEAWGCNGTETAIIEWLEGRKMKILPQINWIDVVITILIVNDEIQSDLLSAHFQTWMRREGKGLDVVLVTDTDDPRADNEIVPAPEAVLPRVHLYRSPARKEGKHARFKVIDSLRFTREKFESTKTYFLKMDPDAVLMAQNLLGFLQQLNLVVGQNDPAFFGLAMCHDINAGICHAGGALYGMNKLAVQAVDTTLRDKKYFNDTSSDLLKHEDFMVAYAFKRSTNMPIINCGGFYTEPPWKYARQHRQHKKTWVSWPLTEYPICFHHIRDAKTYRNFDCYFYDDHGNVRPELPWSMIFRKLPCEK